MSINREAYLHLLNKTHRRQSLKYRNKKVFCDGHWWDSKKEYYQYLTLKVKKQQGDIKDFQCQVTFKLIPKTKLFRAVKYIADFVVTYKDGSKVIYDVKSKITRKIPVWIIKKKLMYWRFGLEIVEI